MHAAPSSTGGVASSHLLAGVGVAVLCLEYRSVRGLLDDWLPFSAILLMAVISLVVYVAGWHRRFVDRVAPEPRCVGPAPVAAATVLLYSAGWTSYLVVDEALRRTGVDQGTGTGNYRWLDLISSALFAGIIEELAFRAILFASLARLMPIRAAVVVQALIFGFAHTDIGVAFGVGDPTAGGYTAYGFAKTTLIGLALGLIVMLTGRLWPAILAHALGNAFIITRTVEPVIAQAMLTGGTIAVAAALVWWLRPVVDSMAARTLTPGGNDASR